MNCRGGIKRKLLVGLTVLVLAGALLWIVALPAVVRSRVTALTGCPVEAKTISLNPLTGTMRLEEFRLRNPQGFPVPEFVDLALFDVDVSLWSLLGDEIVIPRAVIDLERLTLVTNREGDTNSAAVREHIDTARGPDDAPAGEDSPETRKFRIGELVVRIGSVELVDFSRGGAGPARRTIAIKADHRFTDVTDAKVIMRPLLADLARANATGVLGTLGGLLPGPFRDVFGGALDGAGGVIRKFIDSVPLGR